MLAGNHLTQQGFETIIALTGRFPKGINPKLQEAFPEIASRSET